MQRQIFGKSVAWLTRLHSNWSVWQTKWQDRNLLVVLVLSINFMGYARRGRKFIIRPINSAARVRREHMHPFLGRYI